MARRVSIGTLGAIVGAAAVPLASGQIAAQTRPDPLRQGFEKPPSSARPRVWWHWMNGNITKEGIRLDLEWMHGVGIAGVQIFDIDLGTPTLVSRRLVFMTPPWQDAFRYAASLADRLGLELAIAGSPGFSESGGPWVPASQGMKKLVWSETRIEGGTRFTGRLPQPPATVGPFQNIPVNWDFAVFGGRPAEPVPDLYRDVAVIAYRLPAEDRTLAELNPAVTSSAGPIDARLLWDGDLTKAIRLPFGSRSRPAWIQFDFGRPQTIQSLTLALQGRNNGVGVPAASSILAGELQASADGISFNTVTTVHDLPDAEQTVTFPSTTARYFRFLLETPPAVQVPEFMAGFVPPAATEHRVAELVLHPVARVDHFEQKAGFFLGNGLDASATPPVMSGDVIPASDVIDLAARLHPDGTLDWTAPAGRWAVLRLGYSLLGVANHPASPEGTGLEVDKLSRTAVRADMEAYLARYAAFLGPSLLGAHGLRAMVNDSYEAGAQNWTDDLPAEFARRRGYDLHPWLPGLTGRILVSSAATERFLWDFRRTLGELMAEYHYSQINAVLHAHGMIHYGESHENGHQLIGDGMDMKRDNDVPMGAMWMPGFVSQSPSDADLRESASVAHIYGQNLVAAESMTAAGTTITAYAYSPENLKPTADRELIDGVNRFVIHASVHQALTRPGPGLTLGPFGQWFTRQETWAGQAGPWVTYLARSSYLLQQGHFVADILYYYGQDSNITALYGQHLPPVPEGYAFDFASPHALTKLSVQQGTIITGSGMRYRLLALDPRTRASSLDVVKQIARLVHDGATVVGQKPQRTPSLADDSGQFHALVDALWGSGARGEHRYGEGRVMSGMSLAEALQALRLEPDFSFSTETADKKVWFVHRHLTDGDLYFISHRSDRAERIEARFRVRDKAPEIWHADTGRIEPTSYRLVGHQTMVPLRLDPHEAFFVVFRKPADRPERCVPGSIRKPLSTVEGPWTVRFESRSLPFPKLTSWSKSPDPAIRYFSGTAEYETTFNIPDSWLAPGRHLVIDLGTVKNLAEIMVNGKSTGILWKAPFRTDLTNLLHAGANRLEIRVTNLWVNRLIGDKQPGAKPVAFTTFNPYHAGSPLLESGLIGPVRLARVTQPRFCTRTGSLPSQ